MGLYRTYIDKSTTLIKDSTINTARNEIAQLYYGDGYARHIFYIDFSDLKELYTDKTVIPTNDVKHVLKFTNTSSYDIQKYLNVENKKEFGDKNRTVSFELELHEIPEFWDSGTGYAYAPAVIPTDNRDYINEPANWYNRTSISGWTTDGSIPTGSTAITSQHFAIGNEDVEMDITDFINTILTGNTTYYGFCLKFPDAYEVLTKPEAEYVGFLTQNTKTFFKPFVETTFNDTIKDDRANFYLNKPNKLYLYANIDGKLNNLDAVPSMSISGANYSVTQRTKGVYEADVQITGSSFTTYTIYNDVWTGVTINGVSKDTTLDFTLLPDDNYYNIGANVNERISYDVSITGIKNGEHVSKNEIRKIIVNIHNPFQYNSFKIIDNIQYRLFIKQGPHDINIIDWQDVNRAFNLNYFMLDTSWMIPQKYYIDLLVKTNDESNIYNEVLNFHIKTVDNYVEA